MSDIPSAFCYNLIRNNFYADNSMVDIRGEEGRGEVEKGKGGHINGDRTILGMWW